MDWITGALTIVAMEMIARRDWRGWAVGLVNQLFWLALIFQRELWGLVPLTAILSWRYVSALRRWRAFDANN